MNLRVRAKVDIMSESIGCSSCYAKVGDEGAVVSTDERGYEDAAGNYPVKGTCYSVIFDHRANLPLVRCTPDEVELLPPEVQ